ncbi:MAG TPA: hypothetical protein VFC09_01690 [Candidatus Dormibacteraeota bacterium]|nr:hypothetical protein [Candidatus Dormibacteraeota bacterium]
MALGTVAAIGLFLIVLPLATSLPGKSDASGQMMAAFRPQMTDTALALANDDQKVMAAMGTQLSTSMLPDLAAQLHMTPAQLSSYLAANYPATANGVAQLPAMLQFFGGINATMWAQQANFQQADQIPTSFLPPTSMTMLFVIPGALLLGIGLFGLARPARVRAVFAGATVVSLVMVVGLLSVSMYGKASAADQMTTAFKPVFAAQSVQQAQSYTATAGAMATEFSTKLVPGLAQALHVTPAQLSQSMAASYPAVAAGATLLPQIMQRMQSATNLIVTQAGNFDQSASIPWSPGSMVAMFWMMMAPALLGLGIGAGALVLLGGRPALAHPVSRMRAAMHH